MIRKITIFAIIPLLTALSGVAQEVVSGLYQNPVVKEAYQKLIMQSPERRAAEIEEGSIHLPFFDDFAQFSPFPDPRRWTNIDAYVNDNYSYDPANRGVATLDAIDSQGNLHENASTFPFLSDSLVSRLIRLDSIFDPVPRSLSPADSVYFSFYYQPQGRASYPPSPWDSLVLEFGYNTGNLVFAHQYDSIPVPMSAYILPGDTVFPGDTLYSPPGVCDEGLYLIANVILTYEDEVMVPCDSVFVPEYKWIHAWSSPGLDLTTFHDTYGTYCRQVMIPVIDTLLFSPDFKFRFYNYASLASDNNPSWRSNCDQWNVDYVYINIDRSFDDTTYRDVSFVQRAPSLLRYYEAMPYRQYLNDPTNEVKDELNMYITNLDSVVYNTTYYYNAKEIGGTWEYLYPGGNCNLSPVYSNGYQNCISCAAHACPPVNLLFPLDDRDSALFEIKHYIIGDITPTDTIGDTVSFMQKFFNYYAYDDGTPEEGYGLTPAGSKLAYRFRLNVKDTLRAIQMYFNRAYNDANQQFFNIKVWRDNNGKPGETIYTQANERVEYTNSLNKFYTYMLDEPVPVNGVFYIGYEQTTVDNLNMGYDKYNNAQANIFYNTSGQWYQSTFEGALLMRPLIGKEFDISGLPDEASGRHVITGIYPNPLSGDELHFTVDIVTAPTFMNSHFIRIYNMIGSMVCELEFRPTISLAHLPPGIYLVQVSDRSGRQTASYKLIKNR